LTSLSAATLTLFAGQAHALGLGRLNVQSALGDQLQADIDITSLSPEEASTLQVKIASPDTYRAAGVEYHPALAGAQVQLSRRSDGRPFFRVESSRVVTEPFVDLILEINWATGRLVREYTLLLDPPRSNVARAPAPAAAAVIGQAAPPAAAVARAVPPAVAAAAPVPVPVPVPVAPPPPPPAPAPIRVTPPPVPAPVARAEPPAPAVTAAARPERRAPAAPVAAAQPDEVRVQRGDTLSGIAQQVRASGASLDQMLVSLYRANPDAFIRDNMNLLRAGAVLRVPDAGESLAVDPSEARSVIVAQSADFDAYRRRLAANVASAPEAPARQATGRVQASVDDQKSSDATSPDKLRLSQGAVQASAPEAAISRETESKEVSTRVAELSRNVEQLQQIRGAASAAAPAAASVAASAADSMQPTLPVGAPVAAEAASAAATEMAAAPEAASAASEAVAVAEASEEAASTAAAAAPVAATAPQEEPGLLASLLESPYLLPAGAALLALLAAFGIYRVRARNRKAASETSFMESRLQPDSFFAASGGQRVDTADSAAAAGAASSSMNYSLSQLDAIGDVDPVAEADVYLAYGRDLQAEEILKEAMRTDPNRLAVRTKLLEVYAKRRDAKGFEQLATQLYALTRGEGPDWQRAQELGRGLDPDNPLYGPGGRPAGEAPDDAFVEPLGASTMPHAVMPAAASTFAASQVSTQDDADLDIDLSLDDTPPVAAAPSAAVRQEVTDIEARMPTQVDLPVGDNESLEFDLSDISLDLEPPPSAKPAVASPAPVPEPVLDDDRPSGFVDLSGLPEDPDSQFNDDGDPLERKLDLADEFRQIGDMEGARDLLNEVLASAEEGALKQKAQNMLDSLG
jgi:pilus assembly protein FimV